ncbi:MAG TPA: tetratricopeptide repeat protein [Rhizomicrobium sp.]|nr:tetratricopeptide repeat protein [Rhizomicrobium sp.]
MTAPKDLFGQASALHRSGRLAEAEQVYRQVLAADPASFTAQHMLGVLAAQGGRLDEALERIALAVTINPGDAGALINLANVLSLKGLFAEAVAHYDRALALRADADALRGRGHALQGMGRLMEALASYRQTLALNPADVQALYKQGVVLGEMGRSDEALAVYDRVLAMQPGHVEALNNRGYIWWLHKQDHAHAIADLERAQALAPDLPYGEGAVLHLKMYAADWRDFEKSKAALVQGVRAGRRMARPFMFQALSDNPAELQACARIHARDLHPPVASAPHVRRPASRIRLGYLSGEFREQATAILMAGLYERHDRARFELVAIDNASADASAMSARLKQAFDRWIDIGGLGDADAAASIRAAGIDILINLNGWFGKHRMGVFARRPAPIQVNYLGFPGTLGAPYMDYIIADRVVIPGDEQRFYDEAVVTLPGSYQVNDDRGREIAAAPTRREAGLPERGFVFCNFNQSYKLTPDTFARWMRILKRVDGSVLWLLDAVPPFAQNIRAQAENHGVAGERILFAPDRSPAQHLARLSLADLFLDGLPYNAHTTASDALWAGVPLITQRGSAFPGRVATSLLQAAGLPELVTESGEAYETLAVTLATDPAALAAIKQKLTRQCPLFDTDLFRRRIESAYEMMWQRWLAGEQPKGFSVP